ncbi:hypothetical protein GCM10009544_45830 [Streptomyces stramineus]|uniref:Uncharacterized protein n=1 Tax=Streptomyces stramineus TaxID=173861 RepID=A0ABN1AKE5_9ACTN
MALEAAAERAAVLAVVREDRPGDRRPVAHVTPVPADAAAGTGPLYQAEVAGGSLIDRDLGRLHAQMTLPGPITEAAEAVAGHLGESG